ncbi:Marvel domain containing protein [Hyaloscypha variabilis]
MASRFHLPLRFAQVASSMVVLGLSIYVTYQTNKSSNSSSTQVNFLIFVPCFSTIMTLYMELVYKFAPNEAHQYLPYLIFCIEGAISLFYLGGFIALAVFLAHQKLCAGSTCMASQADAVFAALAYVLWAASATFRGIEISEFGKSVELTDEMNEKIVEEV